MHRSAIDELTDLAASKVGAALATKDFVTIQQYTGTGLYHSKGIFKAMQDSGCKKVLGICTKPFVETRSEELGIEFVTPMAVTKTDLRQYDGIIVCDVYPEQLRLLTPKLLESGAKVAVYHFFPHGADIDFGRDGPIHDQAPAP